jgi:exosortase K
MKTRLIWLAAVVLAAWGLKHYYSVARADDLRWILGPTARLVHATTGAAFSPETGSGYLSRERLFLIEKSCAGVNFMIAAFGMLSFTLRRRVVSAWSGAAVLGMSLLASYVAAVAINAVRITIAMWLAAHPLGRWGMSAAQVHRIEGVTVYFAGMVLLFELAQRLDRRRFGLRSSV